MVSLLLNSEADVNVFGGVFGSALIAAADSDRCNCQIPSF